MTDSLDSLYRDIIMDHYRYPRGRKHIDHATVTSGGKNPSCGDEIELALEIEQGRVKDVSVGCKGCAISVASASILSELVVGKSLEEVKKIALAVKAILKGEEDMAAIDFDLGDLKALQGVKNYPVRVKCALLAWTTLVDSVESWEHAKSPQNIPTE